MGYQYNTWKASVVDCITAQQKAKKKKYAGMWS